jgi:diaminopimelate epimerase
MLQDREGKRFLFEMNMGVPNVVPSHLRYTLVAMGRTLDCTILDVGNPQCAVFAEPHPPDEWQRLGGAIERHPLFPNRTNVSFVRPLDRHSIDVLFFERGAGETMSSGTGSTGAAAAAVARGLVESPVRVVTPAGELTVRFLPDGTALLTGPAEITAEGHFLYSAG